MISWRDHFQHLLVIFDVYCRDFGGISVYLGQIDDDSVPDHASSQLHDLWPLSEDLSHSYHHRLFHVRFLWHFLYHALRNRVASEVMQWLMMRPFPLSFFLFYFFFVLKFQNSSTSFFCHHRTSSFKQLPIQLFLWINFDSDILFLSFFCFKSVGCSCFSLSWCLMHCYKYRILILCINFHWFFFLYHSSFFVFISFYNL